MGRHQSAISARDDPVFGAYPLLESLGNGPQNQASLEDMEIPQELQPLLDCFLTSPNGAPWSPPDYRTTFSPDLVHNHPHNVGYGFSLTSEGAIANNEPLFQQGAAPFPCDGGSRENLVENALAVPGSNGTPTASSTPLRLSSSLPAGFRGAFPIFEQRHFAQPRASNPMQECAQFDWDLKTGEPLVDAKTKRRKTEEEKLTSDRIRRAGGPCATCRRGHRKVILPSYPDALRSAAMLTQTLQCDLAHLSSDSRHEPRLGA